MIERANMPEVSNISLNANYAATTKLPEPPDNKSPTLETCLNCSKLYDKQSADKILTSLPKCNYNNTCLICIKKVSKNVKESYLPDLIESKSALEELTITYQQAHNHHKALAAKYQKYDYIENIIKHHLEAPKVSKTKKTKTKKSKTSDQIKKETALKILASLTEEQRAAILANMAKQA